MIKEQIKAIIKQYADKGKKMYRETVDSRGLLYNAGFWDGYECCAKGLLRELEDVQEESINNGLDLGCGVIWRDKEPVSEDLDSFAIKYAQDKPYPVTVCQAVKAGANWQKEQFEKDYTNLCNGIATAKGLAVAMAYDKGMADAKEQMLAKAVDAVVKIDAGGYPYVDRTIELYDYDKDIPLAKRGDKVKILVIKES